MGIPAPLTAVAVLLQFVAPLPLAIASRLVEHSIGIDAEDKPIPGTKISPVREGPDANPVAHLQS